MPTVPPTYIPLDDDEPHVIGPDVVGDTSSSPTPDPDLDDGMLVPVVTGDGIGAITSSSSLARDNPVRVEMLRPRLSLSDLSLHSPSSIVGTPFDSSPRFEYPFPPSSTVSEPDTMFSSAVPHSCGAPFMLYPGGHSATFSLVRHEARTHSPTHPKHHPRDAPVPPSLAAKKRWSVGMTLNSRYPRKRSRSSSTSIPPSDLSVPLTSKSRVVPGKSLAERRRASLGGKDVARSLEAQGELEQPHSTSQPVSSLHSASPDLPQSAEHHSSGAHDSPNPTDVQDVPHG